MPKNLNLAIIYLLYKLYISVGTESLFVLVRQEIFLTASPFTKSPNLGRFILYSERILTTKQVLGSFALANIANSRYYIYRDSDKFSNLLGDLK